MKLAIRGNSLAAISECPTVPVNWSTYKVGQFTKLANLVIWVILPPNYELTSDRPPFTWAKKGR